LKKKKEKNPAVIDYIKIKVSPSAEFISCEERKDRASICEPRDGKKKKSCSGGGRSGAVPCYKGLPNFQGGGFHGSFLEDEGKGEGEGKRGTRKGDKRGASLKSL